MEYGKSKLIRRLSNTPREDWTNQKLKDLIDSLWRDPVLLRWSGFEYAGGTDTEIAWDESEKIFSITPKNKTFGFYQYRHRLSFHKKGETQAIDLSEIIAEGRWIFYFAFDEEKMAHILHTAHNPSEDLMDDIFYYNTHVADIYYNGTSHQIDHFGDSRHGSEWQPQMHLYLHTAFNARRKNGLTLTGTSFGGDGSQNEHAQFSVVGGTMLHDDFEMDIPSSSNSLPILYKFGELPRYHNKSGYGIWIGANRACFNSGSISVVEANDEWHVLYHIFATNEIGITARKTISVMGSGQYETLAEAYAAADGELDTLKSWMPQQGRLHIATIVVQTADAYTNAVHSRIVGVWGESHPPVTIAENSKKLLHITEQQELSIPGDFETDAFYGIKNRVWQKIIAGGGGGTDYNWNIHSPEQIIGYLPEPANVVALPNGSGAIDETIAAGTIAITAINTAGETLSTDCPAFNILVDSTEAVISWDELIGATGYRVYYSGNYFETALLSVDFFDFIPDILAELPTENTAAIFQSPFTIDNEDTVQVVGEGIDIETEVDGLDATKKILRLKKQQSSWSEEDEDSPNFISGKPITLDGREIELSTVGGWAVWRYVGDEAWTNLFLIPINGEDGNDGREVELRENAGWVEWRYVGGTWTQLFEVPEGGGTDNGIKVAIDFVDADTLEFVYNCPIPLKFTSQESETTFATISPAINTSLAQYAKVTVTAPGVGLIILNGIAL